MTLKNRFIAVMLAYLAIIAVSGVIGAYGLEESMGSPVEITGDEGLAVEPDNEELFQFENMYPGKTEEAEVVVKNEGDEPFFLDVDLDLEGDDILFEAVEMTITDEEEEHYSGPVKDIDSINIGEFAGGDKEEFTFALTLTTGHGDATQGKAMSMSWNFGAEAEETDAEVVDPEAPEVDPAPDPDPAPVTPLAEPDPPDFPGPPDLVVELDPDIPAVIPDVPVDELIIAPEAPEVAPDFLEEEVVVEPEEPAVAPVEEEVTAFPLWPLLLFLIPLLALLLYACRVVILVPDRQGRFKVVARRLPRWKDGKWHVNLEKVLDKHLAKSGFVAVDFRGRLLRKPMKVLYSGSTVVGTSNLRYAMIGRQRIATWTDELEESPSRTAG